MRVRRRRRCASCPRAATALAQAGAAVTLVARSEEEVRAAAAEIGEAADWAVLDVADLAGVTAFFRQRPAFDVLVNNAGTNRPKPMTDVTEDDYDAVLGLNLKSAFFVAQAAATAMRVAGVRGSLIHMSSQMGHVGGPNRSRYCASKWGMEGMSKAFALDLAASGIRSNTIAPTFIETPLTKPFFEDPAFKASVLAKIKLGRIGTVEDLMGAIVDGGWTAE